MRSLFLLRGIPGSGKSTWIKNNKLEPYTLSADSIRTMRESPILNTSGNLVVSQQHDQYVWQLLMNLLQKRMENGDLIIIDATHYRNTLISPYKKLAKRYRYRVYIVDFSDIPLETALKRNKARESYKFVPKEVIEKMDAFLRLNIKPPAWTTIVSRDKAIQLINNVKPFNCNEYDKITIFGDIHGSYEPLKEWFDANPYNEKTAYIFTGDYIDRGIQNKETLEFLFTLLDKKNVLFLEGNHERYLRMYAMYGEESLISSKKSDSEKRIVSNTFVSKTVPQIKDIDKKTLDKFCNRIGQYAYVSFGNKKLFISHGGIPIVPNLKISTEQIIKGTGGYNDLNLLYDSWQKRNDNDTILIHAHRNTDMLSMNPRKNIYNLCEDIEYGGHLRVLTVFKNAGTVQFKPEYIRNTKHAIRKNKNISNVKKAIINTMTDKDIVNQLRTSKEIKRKQFADGFSSYNFSRRVFRKRIWNDITCKARGLFIDDTTDKVVMRSYDKFFAINEMPETKEDSLKALKFPIFCYKKENGFLVMVSIINDKLTIGTKSTVKSDHVEYAKEIYNELSDATKWKIECYLRSHNVTMVFECISDKDNTHPIYYKKRNHLYLLDIIDNDFTFNKQSYDTVQFISKSIGLECKTLITTFKTFYDLITFIRECDKDFKITYEGFVFEDSNQFMFKYKTPFYCFWKLWRYNLERIKKDENYLPPMRIKQDVVAYAMIKELLNDMPKEKFDKLTIIDIEKKFYNEVKKLLKNKNGDQNVQ